MKRLTADFEYYSMPRSGTTMLRLIINSIFAQEDGADILGGHEKPDFQSPVLCNIRDFRDVAASLWRIRHAKYSADGRVLNAMGLDDLKNYCETVKQRIAILDEARLRQTYFVRYEDYWYDHSNLIRHLGAFVGKDIPEELSKRAKSNADYDACKSISQSLGTDFDNIDEVTDLHGMHIYTGRPGTWRTLVRSDCMQAMTLYFHRELERWGYESV